MKKGPPATPVRAKLSRISAEPIPFLKKESWSKPSAFARGVVPLLFTILLRVARQFSSTSDFDAGIHSIVDVAVRALGAAHLSDFLRPSRGLRSRWYCRNTGTSLSAGFPVFHICS